MEKLEIDFWRHEELYKESALFKKNFFPNLRSLTVDWAEFSLDMGKMTQISDRLETLELRFFAYFSDNKYKVQNVEQIPFFLKKLVLRNSLFSLNDCEFLKNCISLRESLVVEHDQLINIWMADYLGDFLTKPNFIWKGIGWRDQEEQTAASALCEKLGIPGGKLYKSENGLNYLRHDDYDFYNDSDEDYDESDD